jgi:hypothetical protein
VSSPSADSDPQNDQAPGPHPLRGAAEALDVQLDVQEVEVPGTADALEWFFDSP